MNIKRMIKLTKKLWGGAPRWLWLVMSFASDVIALFLVESESQLFLLAILVSTGFGYIWYQKSDWKWRKIWSTVITTGIIGSYIWYNHNNIPGDQNLIFICFLFLTFSISISGLFKICMSAPEFFDKKFEKRRLVRVKNEFNTYVTQYRWDGSMCRDLFVFYNKDGKFDTVKEYFFKNKKYELNNYNLYMLLKQSLYGATLSELKDMRTYLKFVIEKRTFSSTFEKIKFFVPSIVPITTFTANVRNVFAEYRINTNILSVLYISSIIFSIVVIYYINLVRLKKDALTAKMMKRIIERILEDKSIL